MSVPGFPWRQEPAPLATRNLVDRRLLLSYHRPACPVAAGDLMGPAVTFSGPPTLEGTSPRSGLGWPPLGQVSAPGRLVGGEVTSCCSAPPVRWLRK